MAAAAVRTRTAVIPAPRVPPDDAPAPPATSAGRAVAYQRVLHSLVRRELRLLAELAAWAPADEADRTAALGRHADLIGRVLLHHHAVERAAVWPALLQAVPERRRTEVRRAVDDWSADCARIDHLLRDAATAARQWAVAATAPARDAFAAACGTLAGAVGTQTRAEERTLLPLLDAHLEPGDWAANARSTRCPLTPREQLFVLGLVLEDCPAEDRVRLLGGLSPAARTAWRLVGGRRYRAAVVRLRGEPPAG